MTSRTFCGSIVVVDIPLVLHPVHHLLYLVVPIDPKDEGTAETAGEDEGDRETDPEAREVHILFEGEVDAHGNADDIIGARDRWRIGDGFVFGTRGLGESLHEIKDRAGCLSALGT
jgi:hypothetical protein